MLLMDMGHKSQGLQVEKTLEMLGVNYLLIMNSRDSVDYKNT